MNTVLWDAVKDVTPGLCLEIGCGDLSDAEYLANKGWMVIAIDRDNSFKPKAYKQNILFLSMNMEDLDLQGTVDLVVAFRSLPFCKKSRFFHVIEMIKDSIKINGLLVATFFGEKDYRIQDNSIIFLSKGEILALFREFTFKYFNEYMTGTGKHLIEIIIKKNPVE